MLTEKTILIPIYKHRLRICVCDSLTEAMDKYPEIPRNSNGVTITYEVDAYLIEYIFEEVMKVVNRHLKESIKRNDGVRHRISFNTTEATD